MMNMMVLKDIMFMTHLICVHLLNIMDGLKLI
jgi:hypothetical protein